MEEYKEFENDLKNINCETEAPEEKGKKFRCPCCGFYTLEEVGTYEVCPVCYWEDD
ncbi:MAG: hypothetical protein IJL09_00855, partial [Lachnospiraceae bacterium]|nr:hypothetical protein [Lachnospiraceae bacterium]